MSARMWVLRTMFVGAMLVGIVGLAGCAPEPADEAGDTASGRSAAVSDEDGTVSDAEVYMLGRSVMEGWMTHWGYDWSGPVDVEGHSLDYRVLEEPDGIAGSAGQYIAEAPEGSVVFFKFCFVDFSAGDPTEERAILDRNEGYVRQVAAAARDAGVKLIVGNALPQVASATTPGLVRQHRAYNAWLDDVAEDEGFDVYDFYGVLAGSDGALKSEYAVSSDDSHLNDEAYSKLDESFLPLLGEVASR